MLWLLVGLSGRRNAFVCPEAFPRVPCRSPANQNRVHPVGGGVRIHALRVRMRSINFISVDVAGDSFSLLRSTITAIASQLWLSLPPSIIRAWNAHELWPMC
jgi:hypothetical protein